MKLFHTIAVLTAPVLVFSASLPVGRDRPAILYDGVSPLDDIFICNPRNNNIAMIYPMAWWGHHCYHPPEWYLDDPWSKIESEKNEGLEQTSGVTSEEVVNTPRSVMPTEDVPEVIESEDQPQEEEKKVDNAVPPPCTEFDDYQSLWRPCWKLDHPCSPPNMEDGHRWLPISSESNGDLDETVGVTPEPIMNTPEHVVPMEDVSEIIASEGRPQEIEKRSDDVIAPSTPETDPYKYPFSTYPWFLWPKPDPKSDDIEWKAENCPAENPCLAIMKRLKYIGQGVDMTPEEVVDTPGPVTATEIVPKVTGT